MVWDRSGSTDIYSIYSVYIPDIPYPSASLRLMGLCFISVLDVLDCCTSADKNDLLVKDNLCFLHPCGLQHSEIEVQGTSAPAEDRKITNRTDCTL